MKKLLFGASALTILFAASCKKSDDKKSTDNTFKFKGTTYTATSVTRQSQTGMTGIVATDAQGHYVQFVFGAIPTADGSYKVAGDLSLTDNTVAIMAGVSATDAYLSTGNDNVSAAVKVSGGKLTITVPDVWVQSMMNDDSTQLSATNIIEK